jgi:hypothetical protein
MIPLLTTFYKCLFFILFLVQIISNEGCKTPTEPNQNGITLTAIDVSCTEAWINIQTYNLPLPLNLTLLKDNQTIKNIYLTKSDTVIYIDSLQANRNYSFSGFTSGSRLINSVNLPIHTMDSTSHNFSYQTWEFQNYNGNILYGSH